MVHNKYLLALIIVTAYSMFSSCEKKNIEGTNFIVTDYEPDIVIGKDDTVYFDINSDGKYDFKAYQHKYSSSENPIFESLDSSCFLSNGIIDKNSNPVLDVLIYGDSINNKLTWDDYIPWTIGQDDSINNIAYLAIKVKSVNNINYGWLLPKIEGYSTTRISLIIDKTGYCKIKNQSIKAGQEQK